MVRDLQNDVPIVLAHSHPHRRVGISVLDRVRNDIVDELREAVRIPAPRACAVDFYSEDRLPPRDIFVQLIAK